MVNVVVSVDGDVRAVVSVAMAVSSEICHSQQWLGGFELHLIRDRRFG